MERRPTHRTMIRNVVRTHVIKLNKYLYNRETETDDFILYGIRDDDCRVDAVILHVDDDFFRTPQTWVALMIHRKPYLISREDCTALERIDDTLYVDLRRIINIPFVENSEMVIDTDIGSSLSSSTMSTSTKTKTPTQSSFYERYNETVIRPMRRKHAIFVDTQYQLFSLARHINDGGIREALYQTDQDMTQYLKTVIDYALIGANFPNKEHRLILENKLLTHYNNVLMQNNETSLVQQHNVFLDFMLNIIICETAVMPMDVAYFDETSIRYQYCTQIKCKMMNECIAWEIFKLKRSRVRFTVNHYQRLIDEYLTFIDTIIPSASSLIPRPEWTRYSINRDTPNLFWHTEKYDQFSIRFEWLPALIKEGLSSSQSIVSDRLRNGFVWLNTNEFHDYFLPCLYRNLLTDSYRHIWMCRLSYREDKFVQSLVNIEQENFRALIWQSLPSVDNTHSKTLLEYSNVSLIHITSPITRKLAKRERIMPRRNNNTNNSNNNTSTSQSAACISPEIDIEEINQYMPPCIKSIIKKGVKLPFMDRVTAVTYLVDMNYSKNDIVCLLDGTDKRDIIGHFMSETKKKQKEPDRLSSLCCNALIAVDGSMGHTARCPYEEHVNGDKRRKKTEYTYDEKLSYRSQCGASLGPNNKQVSHPIDYIRHKINDNKS